MTLKTKKTKRGGYFFVKKVYLIERTAKIDKGRR